jgi:hypothetical protein
MKRTVLALALIAGTAGAAILPAWMFACCIRVAPLCRMACAMHHAGPADRTSTEAAVPQPPPQRAALDASPLFASSSAPRIALLTGSHRSHRNFVSLGALRCDDDVGLYTWLATFLI